MPNLLNPRHGLNKKTQFNIEWWNQKKKINSKTLSKKKNRNKR
jgi:hypothetical protein